MAVATTSPTMTRIKRVDSFIGLDPRARPGCKGRASRAHPQATPAGGPSPVHHIKQPGLVARISRKRVYAPRPRRQPFVGSRSLGDALGPGMHHVMARWFAILSLKFMPMPAAVHWSCV